jgi:hypothetical protein
MSQTRKETICTAQYAVAFIDLLGQGAELRQRFLPIDCEERRQYLTQSVGKIFGTQENFQKFYEEISAADNLSVFNLLPNIGKQIVPDMAPGKLSWQRFSDGFVVYVPLSNEMTPSPLNSIWAMLTAVGYICLTNLAAKAPVRVGLDVAWGLEYRPNELYGAAIAFAYDLESNAAQYPRAVVGEGLTSFLNAASTDISENMNSRYRTAIANQCCQLLCDDEDGRTVVNFLAPWFVKHPKVAPVVMLARSFAESQHALWTAKDNKKLAERYAWLLRFFESNSPAQ